MLAVGFQPEGGVDAADDEDVILGFDFADGLGNQAGIGRINLTRLQRASEGAGESTGSGGDDVIEGGGVGIEDLRRDLIVFGDGAMDAEQDGRGLGRQPGAAERALEALDFDLRAIDDVGHGFDLHTLTRRRQDPERAEVAGATEAQAAPRRRSITSWGQMKSSMAAI